jgi:hypothetical protein
MSSDLPTPVRYASIPLIKHFVGLIPALLRRARHSKRARSHGSDAAVGGFPTHIRSVPNLGDRRNELGFRRESPPPQSTHLDEPPSIQLELPSSQRHESQDKQHATSGAERSRRPEQSVFADLGGSESAMDITKKVCWRYINVSV